MQTVDVLIPVRWPAPWLSETLNSVRAQTVPPSGVIVVVHGDAGEASDILQSVLPTARVLSASADDSFAEVLNRGLRASSADLIARVDADDLWQPDHLNRLAAACADGSVLVGGAADYIDETGRDLGLGVHVSSHRPDIQLLYRNPFVHSAVVYRRRVALDVGGYQPCRAAEDLHLWLRMASQGRIAVVPEVSIRYRLHSSQASGTTMKPADVAMIWQARRELARRNHIPRLLTRLGHERWVRRHISANFPATS